MGFRFVSAGVVEYRPWRPPAWALLLVVASLTGTCLGIGIAALWPKGPVGDDEYQLWRWEANTLLDNAFARLGIGPDPDEEDGESALARYFELTSQDRKSVV